MFIYGPEMTQFSMAFNGGPGSYCTIKSEINDVLGIVQLGVPLMVIWPFEVGKW